VDTIFNSPDGQIQIGTESNPIPAEYEANIIIIADVVADPAIDPILVSRGFVPHGPNRIVGANKTDFAALEGDALTGETALNLQQPPVGWQVGDQLVLGGTYYDPAGSDLDNSRFHDELLTVTEVNGNVVSFSNDAVGFDGLRWDHVRASGTFFEQNDLTLYVANLTRNITFRSELDPSSPELTAARLVPGDAMDVRRGHHMVMHTADSITMNAAFVDFGRLNKEHFINDPGADVDGTNVDDISSPDGSNKRGRYSFHLHKNLPRFNQAVDFGSCNPAVVRGNVVWGSPGWGFVHHDSWAVFEDNVCFDVLGSAFVQEAGNEIGVWRNNISIKSTGDSNPSLTVEPFGDGFKRVQNFDFGFNGEAYWVQGARMVEFYDNIAVSAAGGGIELFADVDANQNREADIVPRGHLPERFQSIITYNDSIVVQRVPQNTFDGFEVYNSDFGLLTWNICRTQGDNVGMVCPCDNNLHRVYGAIENFKFWNIYGQGIHLQYTAQMEFRNGLVAGFGNETPGVWPITFDGLNGDARIGGIHMNGPTTRLVFDNVTIEGWELGIRLPNEGRLNSLDGGDTFGETSFGHPLRASTFRNLQLANNRQNMGRIPGFWNGEYWFKNHLRIEGGTFLTDQTNDSPVADFTSENVGPLGVVTLDGIVSMDNDTPEGDVFVPGAGFDHTFGANLGDPNHIVAYGWDVDSDGELDAFGERVNHQFACSGQHDVSLTVWDHQGATDTITRSIFVESAGAYSEILVDSGFNQAYVMPVWDFHTGRANEGWFYTEGLETPDNGQGHLSHNGLDQIVFNNRVNRGLHDFQFDLLNYSGNDLTVRIYGVQGEFVGNPWEVEIRENALGYDETILLEDSLVNSANLVDDFYSTTIDLGDGYDYIFVGFRSLGDRDGVRIDNVSLTGNPNVTPICQLGDINGDGLVNLLDVAPFVDAIGSGEYVPAADINGDGLVNLLDVNPFIDLLNG
ncbi:MAG: PKD domain-containing protein, partial [Planctomycetota bacterium]